MHGYRAVLANQLFKLPAAINTLNANLWPVGFDSTLIFFLFATRRAVPRARLGGRLPCSRHSHMPDSPASHVKNYTMIPGQWWKSLEVTLRAARAGR
jgi:hypothetical protein